MNLKATYFESKKFSTFTSVEMMKGRLASRAHSFKENLLGAFGHASPPSPNPGQTARPKVSRPGGSHSAGCEQGASGRSLAKKTNSTDNLIEYSAPRTTECLVRELQFTLRFFEVLFKSLMFQIVPRTQALYMSNKVLWIEIHCSHIQTAKTLKLKPVLD